MTRGGLHDEPPAGGIDLESEFEARTAFPLCSYERSSQWLRGEKPRRMNLVNQTELAVFLWKRREAFGRYRRPDHGWYW
jgi:hypothetical protein